MRRRGFTFIELMLSILIMFGSSVLVTQGLTRFTTVSETRGAVLETAALLRRAASQTQGFGRPYVIRLTSGTAQTLTGQRWGIDSDRVTAKFVTDRVVTLAKRVLSVSLPEGKTSLVIDAGGPSDPTPIKLTFADRNKTVVWTLTLNASGTVTEAREEK